MSTGLTSFHLAAVVGLLLGDASFATNNNKPRIIFAQSLDKFNYFWFVWNIFNPFCNAIPFINFLKLVGKIFYAIVFATRTYYVFDVLGKIFLKMELNEFHVISSFC